MPVDPEVAARLDLALQAAREAGAITLRYFRSTDLVVDRKSDDSPVTRADRESEAHLRQRILAAFPHDEIVGEELGTTPGTSGFRWVLDPIDGTKSFIHGVPLYGTLVGVQRGEECVLGVIHIPALGETAYAARGGGAWYEGEGKPPRPAWVSQCDRLAESCFVTSEVKNFDTAGCRDVYDRLQQTCRLARTWGDCYGYLLVVTGRVEVCIDPLMHVWDAAALVTILEEAGGAYTDLQGQRRIDTGSGLGTNGRVHEQVLAITRKP